MAVRLSTVGGTRLNKARVSDDPAGSVHKVGDGQTTTKAGSPWYAYSSMWGIYIPGNEAMTYTLDQRTSPTRFPDATKFSFSVNPGPNYSSIQGYPHVGYGNYDSSPTTVTPRQVKNITEMTLDIGWVWGGSNASGLLTETWLTAAATPSGATSTIATAEIGFFPKVSPSAAAFLASKTLLGTYVDADGVTWSVTKNGLNPIGSMYYTAYRAGPIDHHGKLRFKDLFTFLVGLGEINADHYFNGCAFGAEPLSGASSFTVSSPNATYLGT